MELIIGFLILWFLSTIGEMTNRNKITTKSDDHITSKSLLDTASEAEKETSDSPSLEELKAKVDALREKHHVKAQASKIPSQKKIEKTSPSPKELEKTRVDVLREKHHAKAQASKMLSHKLRAWREASLNAKDDESKAKRDQKLLSIIDELLDHEDLNLSPELRKKLELQRATLRNRIEKENDRQTSFLHKAQDKQKIKDFIEKRKITQLIHFTRYENLESIFRVGIITRKSLSTLNNNFYINDRLRLDGRENSISLSLTFPNYKMFYKYRMNSLDARGWVVLVIKPEVLWNYDCAFCKHNAADSRISNRSIEDLRSSDSLYGMFLDEAYGDGTRSKQRLESFDATDPQAEVLVFENIPENYILAVGFDNKNLLLEAKNNKEINQDKLEMAGKYFNSRGYVR